MIRQLWLLFLFLGIPLQRQTPLPTPPAAANVSIAGSVVRAGTNEPIGSVRITLKDRRFAGAPIRARQRFGSLTHTLPAEP
jgi:hypothetical protein